MAKSLALIGSHQKWRHLLKYSAILNITTTRTASTGLCQKDAHSHQCNLQDKDVDRTCGISRLLDKRTTGKYVLLAQDGLYSPLNCKVRSSQALPSCNFSTSALRGDSDGGQSQGRTSSSSSVEGSNESGDSAESGKDQIAAEDRRRAVKSLLDDATTGAKTPDEFDFGVDVKTGGGQREEQGKTTFRQDPSETSVLLFPGQGAQFVGMGRDLLKYPNVKDMFEVASEILGYDLLALCVNGPVEDLNRTVHCQPAVVVTSLAAVERLKEEQPKAIENCVAAAGFSVGEFAALVFGGSISFEDAIYLIKVRAEAMQQASEVVSSGMISVVGGRRANYRAICKEAETYCWNNDNVRDPVCRIANYLFPDARVLAGNTEALSFIKEMSKSFHLKIIRPLPVSGAFHTPLMASAQAPIAKALERVTIETPVINVHSNVDGKAYGSPRHLRRQLKKQVVAPVQWEQTMHEIYQRAKGMPFPATYELGPGQQLGAMLKRNNLKASHSYTSVAV